MSPANTLPSGSAMCDPFCGVGGFVLEAISESPRLMAQYKPVNGHIRPKVTVIGYDKGSDEKDDERTIILAKANALIYFSDLISKHHSVKFLTEFSSSVINKLFTLLRTNLGTFEIDAKEKFDLILTNPPYVTGGSSSVKAALLDAGLAEDYAAAGRGTEALAMQWIVRSLKPHGQAFVIVPDGLMNQEPMLQYIRSLCDVLAVVSLPTRTFYSTPKKTYILAIEKREDAGKQQDSPVFTYFVSEIGETRDAKRLALEQNDLTEMAEIFNQFKGSPSSFAPQSQRCKVIPWSTFSGYRHWMIDRHWTAEEKAAIGIQDSDGDMSQEEFIQCLSDLKGLIEESGQLCELKEISPTTPKTIYLGDVEYFKFLTAKTGWPREQWSKLNTDNTDDLPLYTAARDPVAYVSKTTYAPKAVEASLESPIISFGANGDGSAGTNFVYHVRPFLVSNDRTCIAVAHGGLLPMYVFYRLQNMKRDYGFDFRYKANQQNVSNVEILVPSSENGGFDVSRQKLYVERTGALYRRRRSILDQLKRLESTELRID